MYSLWLDCDEAQAEFLSAELWELGCTGIQEENLPGARRLLRAFFEGLPPLEPFDAYDPRLMEEPEVDWEARTRSAWPPLEAGETFYLAPIWDCSPTPAGRRRLTIHPGMALGTGAHPCTQMCLSAMERRLRPGDRVLDLGTGSGLLVEAAHLLGCWAAGCDIDPEAVVEARRNLAEDASPARLFAGSTRALRDRCADWIVANINAQTHRQLAGEYTRLARRGLILSGFPPSDAASVAAAQRFRVLDTLDDSDWRCLVLCNEDPS